MILIFFVIVSIGLMIFLYVMSSLLRARKDRRGIGLRLLQAFRMLVKHMQSHRGLTAAYIGGHRDVAESLVEQADAVARDISNISVIDEVMDEHEDWLGVTRHWAKLSMKDRRRDPYDNYEQHCKIVASCLAMMRWVAGDYGIDQYLRSGDTVYWYELLSLGEKLGQLRALGTIRLSVDGDNEIKEKVVGKLEKCLQEFEVVFQNRKLQDRIGEDKCDEINTFIALVEHYILGNKSWVSSESYFSRATKTIEIVYVHFDEEMRRLLAFI
ncbi:MAG: nitrate- and nitrite sensing domain-containing protein [Agarilytica sp.]